MYTYTIPKMLAIWQCPALNSSQTPSQTHSPAVAKHSPPRPCEEGSLEDIADLMPRHQGQLGQVVKSLG